MASLELREDLAALRGSLRDRIDRRLAIIVGGSLIAHLGIAVWAWSGDVDTGEGSAPSVAQRFYQETLDVRLSDESPAAVPGVAAPVAARQTPAPIVPHAVLHATPPTRRDEPDPLRMAELLTGPETSPHGLGDMHPRRPGGDLARQIEAIGNQPVTIGNDRHLRPVRDPRLGTDQGPIVDDPTLEHAAAKHDLGAGRIVVVPPKHPTGTTLTAETVLGKIQHLYLGGLQRCYQHGLAADATLSGRVALAFTVDEAGHVIDGEASGLTQPVDSCIQGQLATWQFPVPRNARAEPTEMPFAVVLVLQTN